MEESEEEIAKDLQRVHRDPFRLNTNRSKPRKSLLNFLTFTLKEKILSKALSMKMIEVDGIKYEFRSDISIVISNRQWELGQRMDSLKILGASVQLRFPAYLKVMFNNKIHIFHSSEKVDDFIKDLQSGGQKP